MELLPLTQGCGTSACPLIYLTDRGTIVVQGRMLSPDEAQAPTGAGEAFVEVPREVFLEGLNGVAEGDRPAPVSSE